jgi:NADPH:quinone reductase-like Zn-dependent oxidoreductase
MSNRHALPFANGVAWGSVSFACGARLFNLDQESLTRSVATKSAQRRLIGSCDPMRTVLIIGASKGIGLETVKLALRAGHSVRALSRSATAIRLHDPKLEKLDGDALDRDTIERALVGVDAVIQTLGVPSAPEQIFSGTRLFSTANPRRRDGGERG